MPPSSAREDERMDRHQRRRVVSLFGLGTVLALGLTLLALPDSARVARPRPPHTTHLTTTTATTPAATPPFDTVIEQLPLIDPSRPLVKDGVVIAPARNLPTTVTRPATNGRYPLIVVAHGYNVGPDSYQRFATALASEGFVVAAPSFPLEDPHQGNGLSASDRPNEATDISFVISSMTSGAEKTHVLPGSVGVVGHSDGADVALMIGYQVGLTDPRIRAVIASAPSPMTTAVIAGGPPLLLIHGSADEIVSPSTSGQVMGVISAQRISVTLEGAHHADSIFGPSEWTASFDSAAVDFFDAVLVGGDLTRVPSDLAALSMTSVESALGP